MGKQSGIEMRSSNQAQLLNDTQEAPALSNMWNLFKQAPPKEFPTENKNWYMAKVHLLLLLQNIISSASGLCAQWVPQIKERLATRSGMVASGGVASSFLATALWSRMAGTQASKGVSALQYLASTASQAAATAGVAAAGEGTTTVREAMATSPFLFAILLFQTLFGLQNRVPHQSWGNYLGSSLTALACGAASALTPIKDQMGWDIKDIAVATGGAMLAGLYTTQAGSQMMREGGVDPTKAESTKGANLMYSEFGKTVAKTVSSGGKNIADGMASLWRTEAYTGDKEQELPLRVNRH
eukprot:Lankesteria_metandrocarpae@DN3082_c0_g1_i1.p1